MQAAKKLSKNIVKEIQTELKKKGYRGSNNRETILKVLDKAEKPLTIGEIYERAEKLGKKYGSQDFDQSTTYRIIESLAKEGFVKLINLLEGNNRYELERGDHHHHLVCTECDEILPVHLGQHLDDTEKEIEKSSGFKITSHSLEFFGVCANCKVNP